MRVLCLHPAASSALQFSRDLSKLEERLWTKHGIELVFVDGPLLDAQVGDAVGQEEGGINAIVEPQCSGDSGSGEEQEHRVSRRWYVEESTRRALPPTESGATQPASSSRVQYSGLDASLLHLSQIWSKGGAGNSNSKSGMNDCLPFQGVMGVGQGANVAGLLPLLNYQQGEEEEDDDDDDEKENVIDKPTMFQGLQFVVLVDGRDIAAQNGEGNNDSEGSENDLYVGPDGIQSLHVIMGSDGINDSNKSRRNNSEKLAKQYGPNATTHHHQHQNQQSNEAIPSTPSLSNAIGKFLVSQKNKIYSNSKSRELISLQNQLSNVEQLATLAISQEIQRNPPKALMAVIGPAAMMPSNDAMSTEAITGHCQDDEEGEVNENKQQGGKENVKVVDKAVGAWQGARRRGFGEEGGGAPCPGEFLLREDER